MDNVQLAQVNSVWLRRTDDAWLAADLGDIAQPLRAALTGRLVSPPIDAMMAALGRNEVLGRIAAVG